MDHSAVKREGDDCTVHRAHTSVKSVTAVRWSTVGDSWATRHRQHEALSTHCNAQAQAQAQIHKHKHEALSTLQCTIYNNPHCCANRTFESTHSAPHIVTGSRSWSQTRLLCLLKLLNKVGQSENTGGHISWTFWTVSLVGDSWSSDKRWRWAEQ